MTTLGHNADVQMGGIMVVAESQNLPFSVTKPHSFKVRTRGGAFSTISEKSRKVERPLRLMDGFTNHIEFPDGTRQFTAGIPYRVFGANAFHLGGNNSRDQWDIVAAMNSGASTILLDGGTWNIGTNLVIPSDHTLHIGEDAIVNVAHGVHLTVAHIRAGNHQVFEGPGTVMGILDEVNPAWFGAVPDDGADDHIPLRKAVEAGRRVKMGVGTFHLSSHILIKENGTHLSGRGKNVTTLKYLNNRNDSFEGTPQYETESVYAVAGGPMRDAIVSDFTIDCSFDSQPATNGKVKATTSGILLSGTGNIIRNIRVKNYGAGTSGQEAFLINNTYREFASNFPAEFNQSLCVIEQCEVVGIGDVSRMSSSALITCFIGTDSNKSYDGPFTVRLGEHTVIRDCSVTGIELDVSDGVKVHCFSGSRIEGCTASVSGNGNIEGLYTDTGDKGNIVWRDNRLFGVRGGMHIAHNPADPVRAKTVEIIGNFVDQLHSLSINDNQTALFMEQPAPCNGTPLFEHLIIRDNHFRARGVRNTGIRFQESPDCLGTIDVSNNLFDYQDFDNGLLTGNPNENAYVLQVSDPEYRHKITIWQNNRYLNGEAAVSAFAPAFVDREIIRQHLLQSDPYASPKLPQQLVELGSLLAAPDPGRPAARYENTQNLNMACVAVPDESAPYWQINAPTMQATKLNVRIVATVHYADPSGTAEFLLNLRRYNPDNLIIGNATSYTQPSTGLYSYAHTNGSIHGWGSKEFNIQIADVGVADPASIYSLSVLRLNNPNDTLSGDLRILQIEYSWE